MQRTGRKGHAQFRVIVQDSRRTPTSGNVVAQLGHYDPHTKQVVIDKEKTSLYLTNGAQPSERVIRLLKSEKITLPKWAEAGEKKTGAIRNPAKLRRNRPAEVKAAEQPTEPLVSEEPAAKETPQPLADVPAETVADATEVVENEPANSDTEETVAEAPSEPPVEEVVADSSTDEEAEKPADEEEVA